ncbi:MAG: FMN-binding protein [Gemmatimonadetes bacterium]|nr:FMN-binding protein [Gemmatimonadota bacterium]NIO32018.1 FMN-binding protein [Gemmatimonadota bacterium]
MLAASAAPAGAQLHLTQDEALRLAFPEPALIERETAFLADEDLERARQLAGGDVKIDGRVISYYVGRMGGELLGVAYFDAHRVRTLPEVLMFVVTPDSRIARIEVLRFSEPPEYRPPEKWLDQFAGLGLTQRLSLRGSIVNITGATLTAGAVTAASRRILALHSVINPLAVSSGSEGRR